MFLVSHSSRYKNNYEVDREYAWESRLLHGQVHNTDHSMPDLQSYMLNKIYQQQGPLNLVFCLHYKMKKSQTSLLAFKYYDQDMRT